MTLICDAPIDAAPLSLPLRSRNYAAAALRSVKPTPALPEPTPLMQTHEEQSAAAESAESADSIAAAISLIPACCWPAATCLSPEAAAAAAAHSSAAEAAALSDCPADAEWTAAADDAEMAEGQLDIDQCDLQWHNDADEIDEADDCDWSADWSAEWSRMERLADSLHSVPAAGHSRKSRRAPPHSQRTSAAALRAVTSHSGALAAACAKVPPHRPSSSTALEPQPQDCSPVVRTNGILPSPFAEQEAHEERMARNQMQQRCLRAHQNQQRSAVRLNGNSAATTAPSDAAPAATATPAVRKGELRAAVTAARKLPLHLHRCNNPRWAAVLQARAATKQQAAQRKALASRPPQMAKQPLQSQPKHAAKVDQKSTRADAAAATRKQRRDEQTAKRQLHLQLRREAGQLPAVQSIDITATLVVTLAVTRWAAANPPPIADVDSGSSPSSSAPRRSQQRALCTAPPRPASAFEQFRRRWFYAHRAQIESALPGAVQSIRLADPAPAVQSAFLSRRRGPNEPDPALTFHGTQQRNLASILRYGFLQPGQSPRAGRTVCVANGSAFGLGVYSSMTADYSVSYCRGAPTMLVCATLLGRAGTAAAAAGCPGGRFGPVSLHHNIVVSFDPRRIVPLFFLDFDMRRRTRAAAAPAVSAPAPASVAVTSPAAAANERKRERAAARKAAQRQRRPVTATAATPPQRRFLRYLLRAQHSRHARDGQQHRQAQLQSSGSSAL